MRTLGIWLTTIAICTLSSAAVAANSLQGVGADSMNEFVNGSSIPFYGTILFVFVGFCVSLWLSPVAVKSDKMIQAHWVKVKAQEKQGQSNALSLLRCLMSTVLSESRIAAAFTIRKHDITRTPSSSS